jgi:hypothetical protein
LFATACPRQPAGHPHRHDPNGSIRIEQSTFSGLGLCADDCAHSIYIGSYGSLSITRSRFERGTGGPYVKSRSPRVEIVDSSFDDSQGRSTNYMIDYRTAPPA